MELPTVEAWSYTRGKVSVNHLKLGDNKLYLFLCDPITGYWVEGRVSAETDGSELHPGFLHLLPRGEIYPVKGDAPKKIGAKK